MLRAALLIVLIVGAASCTPRAAPRAAPSPSPTPVTESAVPVESNPPGDIPDSQTFTTFASTSGGYHLEVPEGWSRSEHGSSVVFADKLHSVSVDISNASGPRTPDSARSEDEPKLRSSVRAFEEVKVEAVILPAGRAVLLRYRANSAPNDVTGKVYRLEVDRYEVYTNGKLAAISLAAPAGSDNVDVWNRISRSFGWSA